MMIPTFARRIGRSLRPGQKEKIQAYQDKFKVNLTEFSDFNNITLEIGFGNGEFTMINAQNNPDDLHLACEPYLNGVASLIHKMESNDISNIRIYPDDVRLMLDELPENLLQKVFIICPDPWPKKRYHKRRIIQKDFINLLRSKIRDDGKLVFVTDHSGYAEWILDEIRKVYSNSFSNHTLTDFTKLPDNWLYTKYQRRGLSMGEQIYYFELPKAN